MHVRSMVQALVLAVALATLAPMAALAAIVEPSPPGGAGYQSLAAAGSDLVCGIRADDSIDCWGSSRFSVADHPGGSFRGISASRRAACGIRGDQTMECWGRWYSDVDHTSQVEAPAGTFDKVDLAEEQACAIETEGTITCFGHFTGLVPTTRRPVEGTFIDVAAMHDERGGCGVRSDGTIACWGDDSWGQASPPAGTFTDIAAGRMTVCAIDSGGELQCWGRGLYGAAEPPSGRYTSLAIGGDTGCAINKDSAELSCWGADLGRPPDVPAAAIAIGDNIAGMIGTNGVVHTWGETRLWHVWGGWDVAEQREGFGAFRITGTVPATLETGVAIDIALGTTTIEPRPEFRIASGVLPSGLALGADGRLTGTPETAGAYGPIVIVADNGKAPMASTTIELEVAST